MKNLNNKYTHVHSIKLNLRKDILEKMDFYKTLLCF